MNVHNDSQISEDEKAFLSPEDELLIERLVDGELSDEEREDLLYRLDEKIDGWRFCALSFLEAQSFRSALKNMTNTNEKTPIAARLPRQKDSGIHVRKFSTKAWHNSALSAAAGFLIAAVGFGIFANFGSSPSAPVPVNDLAQTSEPTRSNLEGLQPVASQESRVASSPRNVPVDVNPDHRLLAGSVVPKTVVLNNPSQGLSNITTTCEEVDDYNPQTFQVANSVIPQEVVNHMYNVGGSVDAHRDEYRFPLDNGRVLILPVDTYNVKSDGNQLIW